MPLKPKADWDAVKGFAHDFAQAMEQAAPDRYTATLSKKARKGKIFIDYLATAAARPRSPPIRRAPRRAPPCRCPVTWEMVADGVGPADFSIGDEALKKRIRAADPWADFFDKGKPLDRR